MKMAAFLPAAGADPSLEDHEGRTAAEIARMSGHPAFVQFLEEAREKGST